MTVQSLGLNNQPVQFLGAYVKNVSTSLGLTSGPSTCSVTVVEDRPTKVFQEPVLGKFYTLDVGSNFSFGGIVTKYDRDVKNMSGRAITVNMSDPREIMRSIPMIIAPGYRNVAGVIRPTKCSVVDIFGAYDDFATTGINLSGWNQAGMAVDKIIHAFHGGDITIGGTLVYRVEPVTAKAFGETYKFNFSEIQSRIDGGVRVNSNLLSVADFCQELANRNGFDWYVECERGTDNVIEVTIKTIDRKTDNVDIDLATFLAQHSGLVVSARSGVELRNDIVATCLLGAPVESIRTVNIEGQANETIDLSEEGGSSSYTMTEMEMRVVLAGKQSWETWLALPTSSNGGGGFSRYGGSLSDDAVRPMFDDAVEAVRQQFGKNPRRNHSHITDSARENAGKVYEKLKGHAENSYGKRFVFTNVLDVDKIDAAWTIGVNGGNSDANSYFRNEQGKTRCYVEFSSDATSVGGLQVDLSNIFGGSAGQVLPGSAGFQNGNALTLSLVNSFERNRRTATNWITEADKRNWVIDSQGRLFVAATIEDNSNIIRLDAPVIEGKPNPNELVNLIVAKIQSTNAGNDETADGDSISKAQKSIDALAALYGGHAEGLQIFARCFQPKNVYLPVRNKYLRYGPVFSSTLNNNTEGRLEIEVDDGFCPWEFGGYTLMLDAMQLKVDNQSSSVRQVQTADVTVAGFPEFSIGESLGRNSNINNINISFGVEGVTTQYQLQSFLRKFGELSKEDLARLSLFARRGGARNLPQDTVAFIDKYRTKINRQFSGRGSTPGAGTTGGVDSFD
jgi:hypothetical protein